MSAEFTVAFLARNLSQFPLFGYQNIFQYGAIKDAFIRRKQENESLSMIRQTRYLHPGANVRSFQNLKSLEP